MNLPRPGDRIRLIAMADDPAPLEPNTMGNVIDVNDHSDWYQIEVDWDNGRRLMLTIPPDRIEIIAAMESSISVDLNQTIGQRNNGDLNGNTNGHLKAPHDPLVTCYFCKAQARLAAAIEAGWIPSFYMCNDTDETNEPVCPECASKHLKLDDDGCYEQIPD